MRKSKMHRKGYSGTARCSLERESGEINQDRIYGPAGDSGFNGIYSHGFWFGHQLVVGLLSRGFR